MKFFLLLFLLSGFALGEEKGPEVPSDFIFAQDRISEKYWAGAWLTYDCEEGHWVCVLPEDYKECEEKREAAKKKLVKNLPCAPIGEFPSKRSCFQRVLYLTSHAHGHRFCLLDELKKEELE